MLLLSTNRKSYMGSSLAPSHLQWVTLKGQSQIAVFDLVKLGYILLLYINRKSYMGSITAVLWHSHI